MGFADELMDDLQRRKERAFNEFAREVAADLKELIGTPVQQAQVSGSRGRSRRQIVRSKPGEAPRKETGAYQKSIQSAVEPEGNHLAAVIYTTAKVGTYLEEGTRRMDPRPHWITIERKWRPRFAQRIDELMFNHG